MHDHNYVKSFGAPTIDDHLLHLLIFTFTLQQNNLPHVAFERTIRGSPEHDATNEPIFTGDRICNDGQWPAFSGQGLFDEEDEIALLDVALA